MHFAQKAATEFQVQGLSLSSRSFFQFPFPVVSRESLTVSPSNMGGSPSAKEMSVCMCVCLLGWRSHFFCHAWSSLLRMAFSLVAASGSYSRAVVLRLPTVLAPLAAERGL